MRKTYKARVHAQITIFQEVEVCIDAESEEEVAELAQERFKEVVEDHYGWVDYDSANVEGIECIGECLN